MMLAMLSQSIGQDVFRYNADIEHAFSAGLTLFREGNFPEAAGLFDSLSRMKPLHQRTTASFVMAAKARYNMGAYRESAMNLSPVLKNFPTSAYVDDARFTLALDYMMMDLYEDASYQLLKAIEISPDSVLASKAVALFTSLASQRLKEPQLRQLLSSADSTRTKDLILLFLAQKYESTGDTRKVFQILQEPLSRTVPSMYDAEMRSVEQNMHEVPSLKIGVLLSLMKEQTLNPVSSIATDILDGINFALNEEKNSTSRIASLSLDIRDTERDSATTVVFMKDLCDQPDLVAIIGPLFSNLTMSCAPLAERAHIPLITPTADGDNIAAMGKHVFQLSPDFVTRGKAMARYAVQDLGMSTLAVVSSADPGDKAISQSFAEEAKRLGATIVAVEFYNSGTTDMHDQFIDLRTVALHVAQQNDDPQNLNVPISLVQGVFLPIENAEEIGVLSAQMKYFNINAALLGNGVWNDPNQLDQHKRDVNGVVFCADAFIDETDSATAHVRKTFSEQMKKTPSKFTFLGYDAMKLLLSQMEHGSISRSAITSALTNLKGYRGLHSTITLNPHRANSEVNILKYSNGEIIRMKEISVQ